MFSMERTLTTMITVIVTTRLQRERTLLDEKLIKSIPLINEANAISDELQRGVSFGIKLMAGLASSGCVFVPLTKYLWCHVVS